MRSAAEEVWKDNAVKETENLRKGTSVFLFPEYPHRERTGCGKRQHAADKDHHAAADDLQWGHACREKMIHPCGEAHKNPCSAKQAEE